MTIPFLGNHADSTQPNARHFGVQGTKPSLKELSFKLSSYNTTLFVLYTIKGLRANENHVKKLLTNHDTGCLIRTIQTDEAEIKPIAHPQRAPAAEKGR
jgi:hypothetical protein